jgi:hypothetical protein
MGSQQKEVSFQYRSFWKIEKLVRIRSKLVRSIGGFDWFI